MFKTAPANGNVEYVKHHFTAALLNKTEYMGYPDDETDQRWSDLYNSMFTIIVVVTELSCKIPVGNTVITEEEAKKLHTPTLPLPRQHPESRWHIPTSRYYAYVP